MLDDYSYNIWNKLITEHYNFLSRFYIEHYFIHFFDLLGFANSLLIVHALAIAEGISYHNFKRSHCFKTSEKYHYFHHWDNVNNFFAKSNCISVGSGLIIIIVIATWKWNFDMAYVGFTTLKHFVLSFNISQTWLVTFANLKTYLFYARKIQLVDKALHFYYLT